MTGADLGLDIRAVRATWSVVLVLGALALIYTIRRTLLIFVLAIFLAYLLAPLVKLAAYLSGRRAPRGLSLAVVYILLMALLAALGPLVGTHVSPQSPVLATRLPDLPTKPRP